MESKLPKAPAWQQDRDWRSIPVIAVLALMAATTLATEYPTVAKATILWMTSATELTPIAILLLAGGCLLVFREKLRPASTNGFELAATVAAAISLWLLGGVPLLARNAPKMFIRMVYHPTSQMLLLMGIAAVYAGTCFALRRAIQSPSTSEPYPLAVLKLQNTYKFIIGKWCPQDWEHCKGGAAEWLTLPEGGAYCNVLVLGAIGSGKTSEVLAPLMLQTMAKFPDMPDRQASMLAIDNKGNLAVDIYRWAAAHGREKDVRIIRPDIVEKDGIALIPAEAYASISPLQGFDQPSLLANELQDALESTKEKRSPDYFQNIQREFLTHAFTLLLDHEQQADLADIHSFASSNDVRKAILGGPTSQASKRAVLYFEQEFGCLSTQDQADLLRGLASQLSLLSDPVVQRAFCPTRPDAHRPLESWLECLVEKPGIVVFSCPPALYTKSLSRILALLTLRSFQQAMTRRSDATFKGNSSRLVTLYADEAHAVFNKNLAEFLAVSRQAKVMSVLGTQNITQVPPDFRDELTSGCRTRVILASNDETARAFQTSLGAISDAAETVSFSEGHRGATVATARPVTTRSHSYSMRERPRFSITTLGQIPLGQGVAHVFDGEKLLPSCRVETTAFYRLPFYLLDPNTHPIVACANGAHHIYKRKWLVGKLTCQTCKKTLTNRDASDYLAARPALETMKSNGATVAGGT